MKRQIRLLLLRLLGLLAPLLAPPPHHRPSSIVYGQSDSSPARILVIKPDHLGDMLMATPTLRELRRRFPQAQITALVGPWARLVLEGSDAVDIVHTLVFPGFERKAEDERRRTKDEGRAFAFLSSSVSRFLSLFFHQARDEGRVDAFLSSFVFRLSSLLRPYLTLLHYAFLLRAVRYEAALVLRDDHWWGAALALLAGVPRRVGYAVPECAPLLTDALPWQPNEHVTVQGLLLVAALAGDRQWVLDAEVLPTEPPRVAGAEAWADRWVQQHQIGPDERLVVIHPGTGGQSKLWLPERWSAVGDALAKLPGVRLLVTGGPGEEGLVAQVAGGMAHEPLTLPGTATVGQLVALLGRAALVLGVDSGPLHLAVAAGAPTIHLYGPGDAGRFGPWGDSERQVVLRAGLWCSPCGVFTTCPRATRPSECMTLIEVAQVVATARSLLEEGRFTSDRLPQSTQSTQR